MGMNKFLSSDPKVHQTRKIVLANSENIATTTTTRLAGDGGSHPKKRKHFLKQRWSKSAVAGSALHVRDKRYIRSRSSEMKPQQQPLKYVKNVKMAGVATGTCDSNKNLHGYSGSDLCRPNCDERKVENKSENPKVPKGGGLEWDNQATNKKKQRRRSLGYPQKRPVLARAFSESMEKSHNEKDTVNRRIFLKKCNVAQSSSNKGYFTGKYSGPNKGVEQERYGY